MKSGLQDGLLLTVQGTDGGRFLFTAIKVLEPRGLLRYVRALCTHFNYSINHLSALRSPGDAGQARLCRQSEPLRGVRAEPSMPLVILEAVT